VAVVADRCTTLTRRAAAALRTAERPLIRGVRPSRAMI
jgi:hypothetical protein